MANEFSAAHKTGVYKAIFERRDMRHFAGGSIDAGVFQRLLQAAHAAPSVGLMQPWRVIRITDGKVRRALHGLVDSEREKTADALAERHDAFMRLKVEGILDSAELLVMTLCDQREKYVFGRRTLPEMDLASVSCAIQNMWLAARAEGLGMGWVSLFDAEAVAELLAIPLGAKPVALLCLGPVEHFYNEPMLQTENWAQTIPLDSVVMENVWDERKAVLAHRQAAPGFTTD